MNADVSPHLDPDPVLTCYNSINTIWWLWSCFCCWSCWTAPKWSKKKNIYIYMRSQQKETPQMNNQQWKLNKIQCFYLLRGLMNFLRQQMSYTLIFDLQNCPPIPNLIHQGDSPNLLQKSTSTNRIKFPPPRRSDDVNLTQRLSNHKV